MSLRRGFKAEANRISLRLRQDLGLQPYDPIDVTALAARLAIQIVPFSDFAAEHPEAVKQLMRIDPGAWSAGLLPMGPRKRILLHNDGHSKARQRSNIGHEFAHLLLNHPPTLPLDDSGCRDIDRELEEEANWLGGVLLIPDVAALHIVRSAMTTDEALELYGVSADMLRMRINLSGARRRVGRFYN